MICYMGNTIKLNMSLFVTEQSKVHKHVESVLVSEPYYQNKILLSCGGLNPQCHF
jgi:hypothetical protein